MLSILQRQLWLIEPVIGIAFFVFWAIGEVGHYQLGPGLLRGSLPFWVALAGLAVAVGVSRLQPVVAMAIGAAVLIGQLLVPAGIFGNPMIYSGYAIVVLVVSSTVTGRWRAVALVFAVGAGLSAVGLLCWWIGLDSRNLTTRAWLFTAFAAAGALLWLIGTLYGVARERRASERELAHASAELRAATAAATVTQERERIAQEVHDVMAHSLAVIVAQADGARYLAEQRPQAVVGSLEAISDAARDSLTDVRLLIESLVSTPEGHSTPDLGALDELVDRMTSAGLAVELQRFGDVPDLSPAQQLAVHRIVQESLTNALRHSGSGARARVALDGRGPGLAITVASRGDRPLTVGAEGHGIGGMRERARLAGGWLEAGPDDDAIEFVVTAFIPEASLAEAGE